MDSRLTALLVYPLRGQGGVLLAMSAVGLYLALALLDWSRAYPALHLLTMVLLPVPLVIVLGIFQHYAWTSLRHVAAGHTQSIRSIEIEDVSPLSNYLAFKVALLLLGVAGLVALCFSVNRVFGSGVAIALGCVLPAVLGVIVLEERFMEGLDPRRIAQFVAGLGPAYGAFAVLVYAGLALLYVVCAAMSPPNIVAVLLGSYAFVLGYVLAGTVLYACRDRLGLATLPELDPKHVSATVEADAIDALMVDLHRLCAVDRVDRANDQLEGFLREGNYAFDERIHQRLQVFHDRRLMLEHSWHYLDRLLAANKPSRAWLLLRNALEIDPLFRPGSADAVMALISVAPPHDADYVDMLLGDFERAYPGNERLPEALLRRARWSVERLGRADEALELLARIERDFPERAQDSEFQAFHARARRLSARDR